MPTTATASDSRDVAPLLWLLLAAFAARVVGQMLVAFAGVAWLPPMEAWMSGLMPYRYLLPAQIAILALGGRICVDCTRGAGWFARPRRALGCGLLGFGWVYFSVMALRLGARLVPRAAWLGEPIPVVFHLVLASFVIVFARWHRRAASASA
jgi:hypothetical protein